jgi:hypothetical protein
MSQTSDVKLTPIAVDHHAHRRILERVTCPDCKEDRGWSQVTVYVDEPFLDSPGEADGFVPAQLARVFVAEHGGGEEPLVAIALLKHPGSPGAGSLSVMLALDEALHLSAMLERAAVTAVEIAEAAEREASGS